MIKRLLVVQRTRSRAGTSTTWTIHGFSISALDAPVCTTWHILASGSGKFKSWKSMEFFFFPYPTVWLPQRVALIVVQFYQKESNSARHHRNKAGSFSFMSTQAASAMNTGLREVWEMWSKGFPQKRKVKSVCPATALITPGFALMTFLAIVLVEAWGQLIFFSFSRI